jgi:general secretion pathway protein E
MRLGEILVRSGRITQAQLDDALGAQRDRSPALHLGEILVERRLLAEPDLLEALGLQFGIAVLKTVDDALLDPALVGKLPVDWARSNVLLPVRYGQGVAALTSDPTRMEPIEALSVLLGMEVATVLAPRDAILRAIERCYYRKEESSREFIRSLPPEEAAVAAGPRTDDLLRVADQAPVTQLVNLILLEAVKQRASDVHLEPYETALRVRYRVDGVLYEQEPPPKAIEAGLISRLKVMARMDIAERRLPQDGMAKVRVGEREIDIRVSTIPVAEGERVVLRLLDRESALLSLTDLGMPRDVHTRFRELLEEPYGIILVTGPTGSGKTTSLYAALQQLDTAHRNVLTIEDPIEYQLPGIGQMQVKPKIGLTFANGLRHILRQDPDIVLVGEIRDTETAEIAVRASLTGHLVFSTLHTNDASTAVVRLMDMGVEPYLLASAMRAAMAQRLIRKLCAACRRPGAPSSGELKMLGRHAESLAGAPLWTAAGCPACRGGYLGRTGLYEMLVLDAGLQDSVRDRLGPSELRARARAQGMRTLLDDGLAKVREGVTSLSEVVRAIGHEAMA